MFKRHKDRISEENMTIQHRDPRRLRQNIDGLDGHGSNPGRVKIVVFFTVFRPVLTPSQPSGQWVVSSIPENKTKGA
jgi:hypothetical protein